MTKKCLRLPFVLLLITFCFLMYGSIIIPIAFLIEGFFENKSFVWCVAVLPLVMFLVVIICLLFQWFSVNENGIDLYFGRRMVQSIKWSDISFAKIARVKSMMIYVLFKRGNSRPVMIDTTKKAEKIFQQYAPQQILSMMHKEK